MTRVLITRTVTKEECDWLSDDVKAGTEGFLFRGNTYGCIDYNNGAAISFTGENENPFFEIPYTAFKQITEPYLDPDIYAVLWPGVPDVERCGKCGQPDNCGDCNCSPLSDDQVALLGGVRIEA